MNNNVINNVIKYITNEMMLSIALAIIAFILIAFFVLIVRKVRKNKTLIHEEHVFIDIEDYKDNLEHITHITINTNPCIICNRVDILHMTEEYLLRLCDRSPIKIGEYTLSHGNHTISYLFNKKGKILGEKLPYHALTEELERLQSTQSTQ